MLVNLKTILEPAARATYGVAGFNVFGWEDSVAVVQAAEATGAPIILTASLDYTRFKPIEVIAKSFRALAEQATVPICAHLDHCYVIDDVKRAIDAGMTSVMYDGSQLPVEENIAGTSEIVDYGRSADVSVEAEIGSVPYAEGRDHIRSEKTDVEEAVRLASESGLTAMAVSVGNIHRLREPTAVIDFQLLAEIEERTDVPLVIHGTSGIQEPDLGKLARTRVAKFNTGTSLRQAFGRGMRQALAKDPTRFDRVQIMEDVIPVMAEQAAEVIRILGWEGPEQQPQLRSA